MKKNNKNNTSSVNYIKDLKLYSNMVDIPNNAALI